MLQDLEPLRKGGLDSGAPLHKREESLFPDPVTTHQQSTVPVSRAAAVTAVVSHVADTRAR